MPGMPEYVWGEEPIVERGQSAVHCSWPFVDARLGATLCSRPDPAVPDREDGYFHEPRHQRAEGDGDDETPRSTSS